MHGLGMTDFRQLFESTPGCNLVLRPDFSIAAVSEDYLQATMTRREAIIGRPLFEVFPDDPRDPGATGVSNLRASLLRVLEHKHRDVMPVQRYPIRRPGNKGDDFEERYWSPVNSPVLGADGQVAYIIHHVDDVTDVVRLTEEKLEQEGKLRDASTRSEQYLELLDRTQDAMMTVDEDGRIQLVNLQAEALFGYAREELVGKPLSLLVPERFRGTHSRHVGSYLAGPSARAMGPERELFGRRKDGTEIPIEVNLSPRPSDAGTRIVASIRISERRRLLQEAKRTAERLASAVESIQDAFALFDREDRLILCNSVYRRLLDARSGPLVGTSYQELLDSWLNSIEFPDEATRARFREERLARRVDAPASSFDIQLRDGRKLRVSDRRTAEGGIVKTVWDVTEDERLKEELRQARAAAEAANSAKSEFLSSMSHELRTPLNAILGFAQLLQRDSKEPLSARHQARVRQILHGGEHLLRLIDDVLNLARIEAGRVSVYAEAVSVGDVLGEVRQTLEPMAARQGIALAVEALPPELPLIWVDRTRFAQILLNFGSNAIKYNRAGGRVSFAVSRPVPSHIRVSVRDTGMGIPLDKQHMIFQPFQRAGQETGPIEGTGIGLVITQRLAQLMHGDVGFTSTPGEGSVFWADVPAKGAGRAARSPTSTPAPAPSSVPPPSGPRLILYVEDNAANVAFMRDLIETFEDTELLTTQTAEEAIQIARTRRPAVVLMDINLPGMSGVDALRILRASPDTSKIPIIALTAAATERDKQRGLEVGFYRYLTKPVNVDDLIRALDSLLARSTRD
jgi:PAS domain S-box-containing protein